jgi:proline dehydrogenase
VPAVRARRYRVEDAGPRRPFHHEDEEAKMLSTLLVRASENEKLERIATANPIARRIANRFVAGSTLEEGIAAGEELVAAGRTISLDLVGEHVTDDADADAAAVDYEAAIAAIAAHSLPSGISIKPSQLGSSLAVDRAHRRLTVIAKAAAAAGAHVTLDMEDSSTTETTIALVEALHADGHTHVGCAVQSYLHRTPEDVERLSQLGASLRLCKGAYAEGPSVAHQEKAAIDEAYRSLTTALLERGTYPRFATHDHRLIGHARREARRLGRGRDDYEFQMLYGVRPDLQQRLVEIDEALCIYVPYGEAWYAYFVRRLAERPANLAFFLRALAG